MIVPNAAASLFQHVALISSLCFSPPTTSIALVETPVPIMQVIKAYGSLAGRECFGRQAPPGSSCQLPLEYLKSELGLSTETSSVSLAEFTDIVNNKLEFQWPLKPYGVDDSKSLAKTAIVNKGAETALYMNELEQRGLYNRHHPTGPLPTSLRPQLNKLMDKEAVDTDALAVVFFSLADANGDKITAASIEKVYQETESLDYYGFLNLVGKESIYWPRLE